MHARSNFVSHLSKSDRNRPFSILSYQVHLELLYCPYGIESELTNPFADHKFSLTSLEKALKSEVGDTGTAEVAPPSAPKKKDVIIRGVLTVTIIAAEELPVMDVMGKADPFVVITLKKTEIRNKTRVKLWTLLIYFFSLKFWIT